jgi:phytoene/squalene synthetase
MSEEIKDEEKSFKTKQNEKRSETSMSSMTKRYRDTYAQTRDHRAAVHSYCAGNVWATENAKATGNW